MTALEGENEVYLLWPLNLTPTEGHRRGMRFQISTAAKVSSGLLLRGVWLKVTDVSETLVSFYHIARRNGPDAIS